MGLGRVFDLIFFFYFFSHIPITLFVDSQALMPQWIYPQVLQDTIAWYTQEFRDPMMADPPGWFKSFIYCELTVQFPFFFVGSYAFWKGYEKCAWVRIPSLVYSSHVATTVIAILYHIMAYDFSNGKSPGPRTMNERLTLVSIYSPYLIVPVLILLRMLFSTEHLVEHNRKKKVK